MRAKGFTPVFKIHGREAGKRHRASSSCRESQHGASAQICLRRHLGALRPPPLTQPGQLMIPINNPDPEISDRSYNQSKVSPEAAWQAGYLTACEGRDSLTANFPGSSPGVWAAGSAV